MKSPETFKAVMQQKSDAELIEILHHFRDEYRPEAITAAELELASRNVDTSLYKQVAEDWKAQEDFLAERAHVPLEDMSKFLCFFFPGLGSLLFAATFKADGYDRKWEEAKKYSLYGLFFYIGLGLLIAL